MRKNTLSLLPPAEVRPLVKKNIVTGAAIAAAVYIAALSGAWFLNNYELTRLNNNIETLKGNKLQMQQYLAVAQTPGGVASGADPAILEMMRTTPPWDAVLSELSMVVPQGVWLEIVESQDGKSLRFRGYAAAQPDIARFIENLERSRYFGNIEIVYAQRGGKATAFELKAEIIWT